MTLKAIVFTTLVVLVNLIAVDGQFGAYGPTLKATAATQKLCNQVKCQVRKETGVNYKEFIAVEYRVQVVTGTNVLIKVHVGGSSYIHLTVFEALPVYGGQVTLMGVLENQTRYSPLVPFL